MSISRGVGIQFMVLYCFVFISFIFRTPRLWSSVHFRLVKGYVQFLDDL